MIDDGYDDLLRHLIGWPTETVPRSDREMLADLRDRLRKGRLSHERAVREAKMRARHDHDEAKR